MVIGRLVATSSSPITPSSPFFSTPTLTFAKAGMYFDNGSSSCNLPSLHQHHRGDRSDRLRHRIDAENAVWGHRLFGGGVTNAETAEICRLAVALNHHQRARNFVLGDFVLDVSIQATKTRLGEPNFGGLGRYGAFRERIRNGDKQRCGKDDAGQAN